MNRIFIPIKAESQRVPRKNFRQLGSDILWKRCVKKFINDFYVDIDTDSEEIIAQASEFDWKLTVNRRKDYLIGHDTSVNLLIEHWIKTTTSIRISSDVVCQIHVTSPFLQPSTVKKAFDILENNPNISCVVGCNTIQSRLWRKEAYGYSPVNHNPLELRKTQDLPTIYEENSSLYAFRVSSFLNARNRMCGANVEFLEVGFPENVDIDTEQDWDKCVLLEKAIQ